MNNNKIMFDPKLAKCDTECAYTFGGQRYTFELISGDWVITSGQTCAPIPPVNGCWTDIEKLKNHGA